MNKVWFRNKTYGWGWTPACKEGWYVVVGYIGVYLLSALIFAIVVSRNEGEVGLYSTIYLLWIFLITASMIYTAFKKGEKLEWRWGKKKK